MNDPTRPFSKGKYRFVGFLVLGLLLIFSPAVYSSPTTFWVSPSGDDGSPGTKIRPFRTLERARDAVRAVQESQGQQDTVVYLRGGTYRFGQTFVLDWRDSGSVLGVRLWIFRFQTALPACSSSTPSALYPFELASLKTLPPCSRSNNPG